EAGRGFAEPGAGSGGIGSAQRGAAARALDGPPEALPPPDMLGIEPAVGTHDLPGDEARLLGDQEERHRGDLLGHPGAAERRAPASTSPATARRWFCSASESWPMPALLARMSTPPHSAATCAKVASTCALSATSVWWARAVPPPAAIARATRSAPSPSRSTT